MSKYELCLLDCQSIQQYVFGSNKLRTNIGASENVAAIFEETLKKTLPTKHDITSWVDAPESIKIFDSDTLDVEAGYIGGGNALLIFRKNGDIEPAKDFVKKWSRQVLLEFPGIVPAAITSNPFSAKEELAKNINSLFEGFAAEKNEGIQQTTLPRHGITAECRQTGLSAEIFNRDNKQGSQWVSSSSYAKIITYKQKANSDPTDEIENEIFQKLREKKYQFAFNEEQLGQTEANNHIAVVHIDGNSMGKTFMACDDLPMRRRLSKAVNDKTKAAWRDTVFALLHQMDTLITKGIISTRDTIDSDADDNADSKNKLPLRKLILNGDDLTFVCNAKIAFWLTETFLKKLAQGNLDAPGEPIKMSACAGIAIVKTKFPFYRAYQLAEDLCGEAKKKGRPEKESWIDFEIVYGGLSGDLDQTRYKKYSVGSDTMLWRPWRVLDAGGQIADTRDDFASLKIVAAKFLKSGSDSWPRSKRKELLKKLTQGRQSSSDYSDILKARGLKLPDFPDLNGSVWKARNSVQGKLTENETNQRKSTPYFDILQALEFYPIELLKMEVGA